MLRGAVTETEEDLNYAQRVGTRLRAIRRQKRLSLQEVEASSGYEFKASVLGAYERGERAISVPRLYRLARFYGVPADRLLPEDETDVRAGSGSQPTEISLVEDTSTPIEGGDFVIDLTRLADLSEPEIELLTHYLRSIQMQRQDFNGRLLSLRRDDLRAIACLFDTTPDAIRGRLDELGIRLVL